MAITTMDGVLAGCKPPQLFYKAVSGTLVAGRPWTNFYANGIPGPAVAPTPGLAGAALTSYPGQIPFTNPGGGQKSYLARFAGLSSAQAGTLLLCDRLWHNSGLVVTTTGAQTVNSVAFPARDNNASTNGEGVMIGLEIRTATGAGAATPSISYTDSDGNAGNTASLAVAYGATSGIGSFYPFALAAGDKGVRSIQTYQGNVSMSSGAIGLVAYRVLATLPMGSTNIASALDALTSGMPEMFDNTVPFLVFVPSGTNSTILAGQMIVTQG
jgi:hypothetical protein